MEAGRYAPSGGNNQTTHFLVEQNKEVLNELGRQVRQEFAKMEVTPDTYKTAALWWLATRIQKMGCRLENHWSTRAIRLR